MSSHGDRHGGSTTLSKRSHRASFRHIQRLKFNNSEHFSLMQYVKVNINNSFKSILIIKISIDFFMLCVIIVMLRLKRTRILDYLTEDNLIDYLKIVYPQNEWTRNKAFPGYKFRPDYRCDEIKLVVEFNGYQHYTKAKVILSDYEKYRIMTNQGYTVLTVPYFIQMSTDVIKLLFNKEIEIEQIYPHGFIADNNTMLYPADFCELGVKRFKEELEYFTCCRAEIIKHLKERIKKYGIDIILPPSLHYIIH